jgi:hypothetical protein
MAQARLGSVGSHPGLARLGRTHPNKHEFGYASWIKKTENTSLTFNFEVFTISPSSSVSGDGVLSMAPGRGDFGSGPRLESLA